MIHNFAIEFNMNKFSKGLLLSLVLIYSHEILATEKLVVWEDIGRAATIE